MTPRLEMFLDHIRTLAALDSLQHARRAGIAALRGFIAILPAAETQGLAALLEEALAAEAAEAASGPEAAVAAALGVPDERARAISGAVVLASLEALGAGAAALLAALPEGLKPTAQAPRKDMKPGPRKRPEELVRTLAAGRPGSQNPVAEGTPLRAHKHSIAQSNDPHADTRLSSAKGLTPPARTLADARSGEPGKR